MSGTATPNLPLSNGVDDVVGNSGGNTVRVALSRLAALLSYLQGPAYKTSAELFADKAWPDGAIGQVYGDTAGQNGTYRKSGAAGTGSWTRTGDLAVSPLTAAQLADKADLTALNALITEVRSGRVFGHWSGNLPTLTPPEGTDWLLTPAGGSVQLWAPVTEGGTGEEYAQDATGQWWLRRFDARDLTAERAAREAADNAIRAAARDGLILPLVNVAGTGDAITADLSTTLIAAGITTLSSLAELDYVPIATNAAVNPTITVAGVTLGIRDAGGGDWPAGGFRVGYIYKLRRRGTTVRVSGGLSYSEIIATQALAVKNRDDLAAETAARASTGIVRLSQIAGTPDAITAIAPANTRFSIGDVFAFQPVAANTIAKPVITVANHGWWEMATEAGDPLPVGRLRPGLWHIARIMTNRAVRIDGVWPASSTQFAERSLVDGVVQQVGPLSSDVAGLKSASNDNAFLASALIEKRVRSEGQLAPMDNIQPVAGSGSKTMVMGASSSPGFVNGGVVTRFRVYLTAAGRFSVSSWSSGDRVLFTPSSVKYFDGVEGWNDVNPDLAVPKGGFVGFGVTTTGTVGKDTNLPSLTLKATSTTENQAFSSNNFSFPYLVRWDVTEPTAIKVYDGLAVPAELIEKQFLDGANWTVNGAALENGSAVSGANSTWLPRLHPANYPDSQLSRRTLHVFAAITDSNQVWGASFIRRADGYQLLTPAAILDGTDNKLKVYRYDSSSASAPPSLIAQADVPWALSGSLVRLEIRRVRFATTVTAINLVTGQSATLRMDYADGTGGDCRPWGVPCVLFPSTTAGGVRVSRVRMVADWPRPSSSPARVVMIGDSITEASQIGPDYDQGWAYQIEDERAANGMHDTVIAARGGQRAEGASASIAETARLMDKNTLAIVLLGTNNAVHGTGSHEGWRTAMSDILSTIKSRTSRIALGCLPPMGTGDQAIRDAINADILGGYFAGLLPPIRFDLALSANNDGQTWNMAYRADSVHPNVAGQAVMVDRVRLDCPAAFE